MLPEWADNDQIGLNLKGSALLNFKLFYSKRKENISHGEKC